MANTDKLTAVVAMLAERDEEFRPLELAKLPIDITEPLWALSALKAFLGYGENESIDKAVNRAKISAGNAGFSIKEHFRDGTLFDHPGETFITKYAAALIAMNGDVRKPNVAIAQSYFALQVDRQQLEDEKRLKGRLDVANENHKLSGVAAQAGVNDFKKFFGIGVSALYGGKSVAQIQHGKGLGKSQPYLDYAGSEELAANLFRITQTAAALRRQDETSESKACDTHKKVALGVRQAIMAAGNTPPERLAPAKTKIDAVATEVKKKLKQV